MLKVTELVKDCRNGLCLTWDKVKEVTKQCNSVSQPALLALGAGYSLLCGWPVNCRKFRSIPGLQMPVATSSPPTPVMTNENVVRHSPMSPGGENQLQLRTTGIKEGHAHGALAGSGMAGLGNYVQAA